jgi:methylmalonyl-CoA mutase
MSDPLTLTEFPPISNEQWDEVVRNDLKGAAPRTKLFYRAEDLQGLEYLQAAPGEFPYTRGTLAGNAWRIRAVVHEPAAAQAALDGGADEICFVLDEQNIDEVLETLPRCAVHFETRGRAGEVLEALARKPVAGGSLDYVPFEDFDRGVALLRALSIPKFRPITVRVDRRCSGATTLEEPAQNGAPRAAIGLRSFSLDGGAGDAPLCAVQELGFALAEGVEIMAQLTDRGFTPDEAARALAFSFAAGSSYFTEIAKLRAARTLWARAMESFRPADTGAGRMTIYARTSHCTKTIYDPYINVLRATTEAMAAAIGGADSIQVEAFDRTYRASDEASLRLARNTQLILKQEAWLDRTVDPAGGSYYLETLTDSLAREAWALFQQVEAAGGFLKYSESGALDDALAKSQTDRESSVSKRRTTIVGTNQYPNLLERMLPRIEREDRAPRDARIFEAIRLRTERYAARTGHTPRFLLLEAGDVKMRKARSGFITNFFGCAGFEIESAEAISGDPDAIVLCSSDAEYAALAPRVIRELRDAGKTTPVIVAGNPADAVEQLTQAGVADFVHVRSNAAEVLRGWQERLGVSG